MGTKFFKYRQNNSGGRWAYDPERGISAHVWIEARTAEIANAIAETVGIYFNGCLNDIDCSCCGDRWGRAWERDGEEAPTPSLSTYDFGVEGLCDSYIHYLDGRVEVLRAEGKDNTQGGLDTHVEE